MLPRQPFIFIVSHHFFGMKRKQRNYFQDNYLIKLKFGREGYFGYFFGFELNSSRFLCMTSYNKRAKYRIYPRNKKFMASLYRYFLPKTFQIFHVDVHKIVKSILNGHVHS